MLRGAGVDRALTSFRTKGNLGPHIETPALQTPGFSAGVYLCYRYITHGKPQY